MIQGLRARFASRLPLATLFRAFGAQPNCSLTGSRVENECRAFGVQHAGPLMPRVGYYAAPSALDHDNPAQIRAVARNALGN